MQISPEIHHYPCVPTAHPKDVRRLRQKLSQSLIHQVSVPTRKWNA
jgi:hypothetical protein